MTAPHHMDGLTPWYLRQEVLDILRAIRGTELPVVNRSAYFPISRDDWQEFDDGFVSSLDAWVAASLDTHDCRVRVCDLIAAVTGQRLCGVHFLSDEPELLMLADAIDEALDDRSSDERIAA